VPDSPRYRTSRSDRVLHASPKLDIDVNLDGDLSIGTMAARHRLPVRYVQRLFEAEGTSCTEFVLEQRLARARRILVNRRLARLKTSNVAIEAGFSKMSHFYATFRRRYGTSPADLSAQAQNRCSVRRHSQRPARVHRSLVSGSPCKKTPRILWLT
jgi:AraC-like DNA-binding protein